MIPNAVIFDWDITLVNSVDSIHAALEDTFIKYSNQEEAWSREEVLHWLSRSMRVSFKDIFGDKASSAASYFYQEYKNKHLKNITLAEGASYTLEILLDLGVYLAVVSSKRGDLVREEAGILDVNSYFKKIIGSADAAEDKPEIAPMKLAIENANFNLDNNVWYVGDCGIDVVCARKSSCYSIILGSSPAYVGETVHNPDMYFSNHKEFHEFIIKTCKYT